MWLFVQFVPFPIDIHIIRLRLRGEYQMSNTIPLIWMDSGLNSSQYNEEETTHTNTRILSKPTWFQIQIDVHQ